MSGADVDAALTAVLRAYVDSHQAAFGHPPRQVFDPGWPSPCQRGSPDREGIIEWLPVRREHPPDFTGLERALEQPVHPDLKIYFGTYYADVIGGRTAEGRLQLVQVWNDADFDRLVENSLGHALSKLRSRQPLTLFFATTDEDEYFLSVDNHTGAVLLESPGLPPVRTLAPDLGSFLSRIEPVPEPPEGSRE